MLSRNSRSGHPCLIPDLSRKAFRFALLNMVSAVDCSYIDLHYIESISSYSLFVECFYHDKMLSFVTYFFWIYWDNPEILILHAVNVTCRIDGFLYVEPSWHPLPHSSSLFFSPFLPPSLPVCLTVALSHTPRLECHGPISLHLFFSLTHYLGWGDGVSWVPCLQTPSRHCDLQNHIARLRPFSWIPLIYLHACSAFVLGSLIKISVLTCPKSNSQFLCKILTRPQSSPVSLWQFHSCCVGHTWATWTPLSLTLYIQLPI